MIAFRLRCLLAVFAVALLAQFCAAHPLVAGLGVFAAFLALPTLVVIGSFAISRRHAFTPPAELAPRFPGAVLIVLREWLALVALFVFIQPFERMWLGDERLERSGSVRSGPGGTPVLLVHGYMCNRGIWWWIRRELAARGFAIATINLEPPRGDIEGFADQLDERIEFVCASTGAAKVALVGHSENAHDGHQVRGPLHAQPGRVDRRHALAV